ALSPTVGRADRGPGGAAGRPVGAVVPGATPVPGVGGATPAAPSSPAAPAQVATTPQPGTQPTPPPIPAPVSSEPKSTILLGSVGTESGPIGQQLVPLLPAARAWISDVNARGGLNGHPVKLITGDDGGDPNRALALARRMVDEDKVA